MNSPRFDLVYSERLFGEKVYKQGNQVATKQTITSLPDGMRLSLNLREVRKEGRDITLYLSIVTRVYPLPVPAYSENQFLHSMPHPPFSNLNRILPSFTQPPHLLLGSLWLPTVHILMWHPLTTRSLPPPPQTHVSRRETHLSAERRLAPIATNTLTTPSVTDSPLSDQVRVCSEKLRWSQIMNQTLTTCCELPSSWIQTKKWTG